MTNTAAGAVFLTKIGAFRLPKNQQCNEAVYDDCSQHNNHDTTYDDENMYSPHLSSLNFWVQLIASRN